jgi:hypothetical protein
MRAGADTKGEAMSNQRFNILAVLGLSRDLEAFMLAAAAKVSPSFNRLVPVLKGGGEDPAMDCREEIPLAKRRRRRGRVTSHR